MEDSNAKPVEAVATIHQWWSDLNKPAEPGQPSRRGELAGLRRCSTLAEVVFDPAFQRLFNQIPDPKWKNREHIAAIAGVLAHVKQNLDEPKRFASLLGTPREKSDAPRVSELRFQRLVQIREIEELFPVLVRILHLAGDAAPIPDLIESLYWWGDQRRSKWTYHYYNAMLDAQPAPRTPST